jgi:hypothetical protein
MEPCFIGKESDVLLVNIIKQIVVVPITKLDSLEIIWKGEVFGPLQIGVGVNARLFSGSFEKIHNKVLKRGKTYLLGRIEMCGFSSTISSTFCTISGVATMGRPVDLPFPT